MDSIKPILAAIKKYHFWGLAVICVLTMLYCWNSAVGQIEDQFGANKTKVVGQFQKMAKLDQQSTYPNPDWEKVTTEKGEEVVKRLKAASQQIVKEQAGVLTWSDTFSELFRETAATKQPGQWPEEMIEEYRLQMPNEVQRLRTVIEAADGLDQPGVQWNAEDYAFLLQAYTWDKPPAQQDVMPRTTIFWLYENLARIIAQTNEGAPDKFNLPIHTVESLAVSTQANYNPAEWRIAGLPDDPGTVQAPTVPGYVAWPFRIRVRMDLKHLKNLLTACANSDLPMEIQGVHISNPSSLIEIKKEDPKKKKERRFHTGGPFAGTRKEQEAEKEEEEEEPIIQGRGTLVEIWGAIYLVEEGAFDQLFTQPAAPDQTASTPITRAMRAIHILPVRRREKCNETQS